MSYFSPDNQVSFRLVWNALQTTLYARNFESISYPPPRRQAFDKLPEGAAPPKARRRRLRLLFQSPSCLGWAETQGAGQGVTDDGKASFLVDAIDLANGWMGRKGWSINRGERRSTSRPSRLIMRSRRPKNSSIIPSLPMRFLD